MAVTLDQMQGCSQRPGVGYRDRVTAVSQAASRAAADRARQARLADGAGTPRGAQPRQLIVTVYGLYSRAEGGWMSVAALISLLTDLGVDEPAVRSSISRLKRRGILHASRRDGAAGYALSDEALAILREGDRRIFRRERATLGDGWLLAVFSVPEAERQKRHVLRSQLARLGFGTAAPGVWIAPAHLHDATVGALRRLGLDGYADLFRADHIAFGDLAGEGAPVVGPRPAGTAVRPVPRRQWPAAAPVALRPGGRAGGLRRLRAGAHRLAAAALPRSRPAAPSCCPGTGSGPARPSCSSPCRPGSRRPHAPTWRA